MGIFSGLFGKSSASNLGEVVKGGAFLVDVRSKEEFASGHVPGSVNIPVDRIQSELSRFKGKESIVVFCRSGNRSGMAKSILESNGIRNVINGGTWTNVNQYVK